MTSFFSRIQATLVNAVCAARDFVTEMADRAIALLRGKLTKRGHTTAEISFMLFAVVLALGVFVAAFVLHGLMGLAYLSLFLIATFVVTQALQLLAAALLWVGLAVA